MKPSLMYHCNNGHPPIDYFFKSGQWTQCPLCDALRDNEIQRLRGDVITNDLSEIIEAFEEFKAKCVCGKLAGE